MAEEAVALFREHLEGLRERAGVVNKETVKFAKNLAKFLRELERGAEAEALKAEYALS